MWHQPVGCNAVGCSCRADAIIGFFAAYTAAMTHYFLMGWTTPELTFRRPGARFTKNLRRNLKFIISFVSVYLKFILSYKFKIFIDIYM